MASDVNKPTGNGYQGSHWRECTLCGHLESTHYGQRCHASMGRKRGFAFCDCKGFASRELSEEEKRIAEERIQEEWEYVGEALYNQLKEDAKRHGSSS